MLPQNQHQRKPLKIEIDSIKIQNFKSCKETSFKPNKGLSVLIGKNASGKTNILRALAVVSDISKSWHEPSTFKANNIRENKKEISTINISFKDGSSSYKLKQDIYDGHNMAGKERIIPQSSIWEIQKGKMKQPVMREIQLCIHDMFLDQFPLIRDKILRLIDKDRELQTSYLEASRVSRVNTHLSKIAYYRAASFMSPESCSAFFEAEFIKNEMAGASFSGESTAIMPALYREYLAEGTSNSEEGTSNSEEGTSGSKKGAFSKIIGYLGEQLFDVISDIKFDKSSVARSDNDSSAERRIITPLFKVNGKYLRINHLSEGIYKLLVMIFRLSTSDSSIILIEEPDIGIERRLQRKLVEYLRLLAKEGKTVIVTTHSDAFIDYLNPEDIFITEYDEDKGTQIHRISEENMKIIKEYLDFDGTLSDALSSCHDDALNSFQDKE